MGRQHSYNIHDIIMIFLLLIGGFLLVYGLVSDRGADSSFFGWKTNDTAIFGILTMILSGVYKSLAKTFLVIGQYVGDWIAKKLGK